MSEFDREPGSIDWRERDARLDQRLRELDYRERYQQSQADANEFFADAMKYGSGAAVLAADRMFGPVAGPLIGVAVGVGMLAAQEYLEQQAQEAQQQAAQAVQEAQQEITDYIRDRAIDKSPRDRDREGAALDRMDHDQRMGIMHC